MWRAIALRWIGALVEPPIAELTTMALRKASLVRMSEGFRSSCDHLDDAQAGAVGASPGGRDRARGSRAEPGSYMPSASASEFIVVAVPMVLQ